MRTLDFQWRPVGSLRPAIQLLASIWYDQKFRTGGLFATTFCDIAKAKNHPDELEGKHAMARHITMQIDGKKVVAVAESTMLAMDRVNCWIDAMIPWSGLDVKLKLNRAPK
jgi:hypothetical protein